MALLNVLRLPPLKQYGEALCSAGGLPVKLRHQVIDGAVLQPFARIGVKAFKGVEAFDPKLRHRLPDAERGDAVHYLRLETFDLAPDRGNEIVHVHPPP